MVKSGSYKNAGCKKWLTNWSRHSNISDSLLVRSPGKFTTASFPNETFTTRHAIQWKEYSEVQLLSLISTPAYGAEKNQHAYLSNQANPNQAGENRENSWDSWVLNGIILALDAPVNNDIESSFYCASFTILLLD